MDEALEKKRPWWIWLWLPVIGVWALIGLSNCSGSVKAGSDEDISQLAALTNFGEAIRETSAQCDQATENAQAKVSGFDPMEARQVASSLETMSLVCRAAWLKLGELDPPTELTPYRAAKAAEVHSDCESGLFGRAETAEELYNVLGGARPITLELKQSAQFAWGRGTDCTAEVAKLATLPVERPE